MTRWYLGIDGGGTGCRARLVDGAGAVLAEATAGPANISTDPEGALANILAAADRALAATGADPSRVAAGMGLAGVNASGTADWLLARLPFARVRIETDAVTTVMGALAGRDGIVAALGTGSVFAESRGGRVRQIGGWGFTLGDGGSGAVLGRMLLARALRAHDGLEPQTPLLASVLAGFGRPEAMVSFAAGAAPADFARHAPQLFTAPDPAAQAILHEAGAEVAAHIDRLQAGGGLPVCWTGGLGPLWQERLGVRWPGVAPRGGSLDGAVRLALAP